MKDHFLPTRLPNYVDYGRSNHRRSVNTRALFAKYTRKTMVDFKRFSLT